MPKATWGDVEGSPWDDDLEDIAVYDGEMPPKGIYRLRLKMLRLKQNVNGDPMLNGLVIINEPAGSKKAQYNGYDTWFNLNVTSQGSRWVNNFLSSLFPENKVAAIRKAFWSQKVMIDKSEPPNILSIGGVKITENMLVSALLQFDSYGEGAMKPKRFMRPTDMTLNESDLDDAGSEEDWDEGDEDGLDDAPLEEGEEDPEFDARVEELEGLDRKALLGEAKKAGVSVKRGTPENDIIDAILEVEFPPEDDEEEPEEDDETADVDDEEEEEEEPEEEEEEPEPEPEPTPKRTRRPSSRAAKPAPKTAAKPAAKEEPAPPKRTGTRRRRAATGEPPF